MLLLKLAPSGNEMFMQILIFPGCGTARIEFVLKSFNGGELNGPDIYPFLTQVQMLSVISLPLSNGAVEFLTVQLGRKLDWSEGPPNLK